MTPEQPMQIDANRVILKMKDRLAQLEMDLAVKDAQIEQLMEERSQLLQRIVALTPEGEVAQQDADVVPILQGEVIPEPEPEAPKRKGKNA